MSPPPPRPPFSPDNNCFDNTFQPGRYKRKGEVAETGQRQRGGKGNGSQLTDTNASDISAHKEADSLGWGAR